MKCERVSVDNYLFQIYFLLNLRAHSKTRFINVHIFIYKKIKFASLVI